VEKGNDIVEKGKAEKQTEIVLREKEIAALKYTYVQHHPILSKSGHHFILYPIHQILFIGYGSPQSQFCRRDRPFLHFLNSSK
jgi:hypothetical protein